MFNWRHMSLGLKLPLSALLVVALVFITFVAALSYSVSRLVEERVNADIGEKTKLIVDLIDAFDKDRRVRTASLAKAFQNVLMGTFELDPKITEVNGKPAPTLRLDGKALNMNFELVDRFTEATGAVATVFAKTGDDFIRVTTSLKNDKGERAIGTLLDRSHPGYKAVAQGKSFTGFATLFGRQYITQYDPIFNAANQVVGLSFVGLDITGYVRQLKATIKEMKVGETGYFYVLDSRPGADLGKLVAHPTAEGKNYLAEKDADGQEYVKALMEQKTGVLLYRSVEDGQVPRQRVVAFSYFKGWEWIVAGGSYQDEFTAGIRRVRNVYALLGAAGLLLVAGLLYLLIRRLVAQPLVQAGRSAKALSEGDLTEIGRAHV